MIPTTRGRSTAPEGSVFAANTPATTSVIGPVGPVICTGVPPNTAATMPVAMAPYRPAAGPSPDATPRRAPAAADDAGRHAAEEIAA